MAERAKFEKWLRDLDAKRESTPAHVFDRVHKDYSGRLNGVLETLKQHTSAMDEHAERLAEQLDKLTAAEQEVLDDHAESELRAQVGELTDSEWESISKKSDGELAKLKQDQELISADLNKIREMLGSVGRPSGASPEQGERSSGKAAVQAEPSSGKATDQDELAFLKSVIGPTPSRASTPASPAVRPQDSGDGKSQAPEQTGDAASLRKPEAGPEKKPEAGPEKKPEAGPEKKADLPATAQPVKTKPASLVDKPVAGPTISSKGGGEEPLAMHVTGSNPIVLRTSGVVEQPKTLKCAECGSMNYPSEWYCERCGAELANI